jgi:nicotinamidase-related amidase
MTPALLIVDIQNEYFPGGAHPLVGPEAAAQVASSVLARFRAEGRPVVHVQHIWDAPDAKFFRPGTPGVEINAAVAPSGDEPVVRKAYPNSFRETTLGDTLTGIGTKSLVVVGIMTSMCVDATVRAAADLGYDVTVIADGCAAPDLSFGEHTVAAADVHAAFLAALASEYATVVTGAKLELPD